MRGSLKGVLSRVQQMTADAERRSAGTDWNEVIKILKEGRKTKPNPRMETDEELRARGRELRAMLAAARR
ncbi:MAG: hypothetical protein QF463_09780 [Vicinamibacterales bacterium]|jgi:hypothetical protein|nr:hypothetical protein [Vicinamibacterales bacterium]MDP6609343.1 hypothetical protein [Vicinamibacterales bacterium]